MYEGNASTVLLYLFLHFRIGKLRKGLADVFIILTLKMLGRYLADNILNFFL